MIDETEIFFLIKILSMQMFSRGFKIRDPLSSLEKAVEFELN